MTKRILIANLIAIAALTSASTAEADRCTTVHFSGSTQQPAVNLPFIGDIEMVDLETGEMHSASVETILLGTVDETGLEVVTSHNINGGHAPGISFVTFDEARLAPTATPGTFSLISHLKIRTGRGAFNCGELVIDGQNSTLSFDAQGLGSADYQGFGRLCRCTPADN